MEEWKHEDTDFITCPHCGYEDSDSWEFKGDHEEELPYTCPECGEEFIVMRFITPYYYSRKK